MTQGIIEVPGVAGVVGAKTRIRVVTDLGTGHETAVLADIMQFPALGTFDVICSFSAFEYIQALQPTLQELVRHLKPGGRLYFITSHRSLFRFFSQIGNAMRQGLWLHARTCSQIADMLHDLGMEDVSVSAHGMKSLINSGLLLEASARKK